MDNVESYINDLQKQINQLSKNLEESEQAFKDFEKLALVWQKAYNQEVPLLKKKIKNLEMVIQEMEKELESQ